MADITLEEMLQAGVHFGHQTKYWNPKMEQHIFGVRDKIHIINLEHTVEMIKPAMKFIESVAAKNNKILFVGTKRTATDIIKNELLGVQCPMLMRDGLEVCLLTTKPLGLLLQD